MKDTDRLYYFYRELCEIHVKHFPDLRVSQLIEAFYYWCKNNNKPDVFFLEEVQLARLIREFVGEIE